MHLYLLWWGLQTFHILLSSWCRHVNMYVSYNIYIVLYDSTSSCERVIPVHGPGRLCSTSLIFSIGMPHPTRLALIRPRQCATRHEDTRKRGVEQIHSSRENPDGLDGEKLSWMLQPGCWSFHRFEVFALIFPIYIFFGYYWFIILLKNLQGSRKPPFQI